MGIKKNGRRKLGSGLVYQIQVKTIKKIVLMEVRKLGRGNDFEDVQEDK